MEPLGRFYI